MGLLEEFSQARREYFQEVSNWELAYCWYWDDWESDPYQRQFDAAIAKWYEFPSDSIGELIRLGELGSVLSLFWAGCGCAYGHGTKKDEDVATDFFLKAIDAGCWSATLQYARLLGRLGEWDGCFSLLEDGVSKNVTPFNYWLAWHLQKRGTGRKENWRIDRLLARADKAGDPRALIARSKFRIKGKLGWRRIPSGFRLIKQHIARRLEADELHDQAQPLSESIPNENS